MGDFMTRDAFKTLVLGLSLVAGGLLNAQTRFRLADPQSLSGAGNGWAVDQATGALSFAIPIATAPGEIPIPAVFHMAASHSAQQQNSWTSEIVYKRPIWTLDTTNLHRPVLGTLHFGYIDNGGNVGGVTTSATYVLEDGTQFASADWTAFTNYNGTFTLPQDFGLAPVPVSSVQISSTRSHAMYTTTAAGLGATISTVLQGVAPVGHVAPTQYCVILDKDRARVMGFLSGLNAWAPLLWLDRFGHQVTFKWTMSTTGLPVGATALHGVVISNGRQTQRGLQVQWATWASGDVEQDLLRADFIGIDAPSILVRGYSGQPTLFPVGFAYSPGTMGDAIATASVAGVIGRPTIIQVGQSSGVSQPSWVGSGAALPQVPPIRQPPVVMPARAWYIAYDTNRAAITDFTDAAGVATHFDYGTSLFPYAYSQGTHPAVGPLLKYGVTAATSTDGQQDPASLTVPQLKRTWVRSAVVSNSWTTTYQEWWPPVGPPERKVELGFGSDTQPVHYGNAKLALQRIIRTADGTELAKTVYTNAVSGLNLTESVTTGIETSRSGEATSREAYGFTDGQLTLRNRFAGPTPAIIGGSETPLEQTNIAYDSKKDKLDISRPLSVTVTRTDGAGTTLAPTSISKTEYDPATRLPLKAYRDGGADGQLGQSFSFDTEGRLATQANFASFAAEGVATTILGYGADGYPAAATTSYTRPANQTGAASVGQSATYDSAGRTLTQIDALGVTTTLQYDTLGRLTYRGRPGEAATTYDYPSERYRTITTNGRVTTELTDGFGRLVRRTLPDGRRAEVIYDVHGRAGTQKEFNTTGMASRSAASTFDPLDRPTGASSAGGSSQTIAYSASADLKQSIVTTSVAGLNVSRKEYRDVLGQVLRTEEPTGGVSTMAYDGAGNLKTVTITDPAGNVQTRAFTLNALGLLTTKTEPETGTQSFGGFNALGRPTLVNEAVGTGDLRTRTILYDGLGRVCKVSSSTGADTVDTFFDGALMTAATGFGPNPVTMAFTYKTAAEGRRLASESTTLAGVPTALTYNYLGTGQLDTITYPSGRLVGYTYDAGGRVTGIQDRTGGGSTAIVSNISFDDWGQRQRLTFGSTAYSDWSTQDLGAHLKDWTIGYTTGGLGDPANPRSHTYDLAERLTKAGEWQNILHDSANRLGHAEAPALSITAVDLNHDVFGNNTSQVMSGTSASSFNNFSFPALPGNQLPGGSSGWAINGRGEATAMNQGTSTAQAMGLVWDTLGRLAQVNTNFGTVQSYTYAPSGLRTLVQDTAAPANNRRYAYTSGGLLMSEFGGIVGNSSVHSGQKALRIAHRPEQFSGNSRYLGTFSAGEVVTATVWFKAPNGIHGEMFLGDAGGADPYDNYTYTATAGNGGWQQLTLTHTMTHDDVMHIYLYSDMWGVPDHTKVPAHPGTIYDDVLVTGSIRGVVLSDGFEGGWPCAATSWWDTASWINNVDGSFQEVLGQEDPGLWRRDVIYLGSEAVAEIDAAGIHELHKDHLGTPRIITNGTTAQVEGKQAFGPYGEYLQGQAAGYKPITGYTGHLQNEASGLIYMRGRFYSPAWHRFVNSDQGVDPNSWNQTAYVGGSPFMAVDPSGMTIITATCGDDGTWTIGVWDGRTYTVIGTDIPCGGGSGSGGSGGRGNPPGGGGGGGRASGPEPQPPKPGPCDRLKAAGVTASDWNRMVSSYNNMVQNNSNPNNAMREFGFSRQGGTYTNFSPVGYRTNAAGRGYYRGLQGSIIPNGQAGLDFHTHFDPGPLPDGTNFGGPNSVSSWDIQGAKDYGNANIMFLTGSSSSLYQYDANGNSSKIAGSGWWNLNCF